MVTVPARKLKTEFYMHFGFMDPNDSYVYVYSPDEIDENEWGEKYKNCSGQIFTGVSGESDPDFYLQTKEDEDHTYLVGSDLTEELLDGIETSSYKKKLLKKLFK